MIFWIVFLLALAVAVFSGWNLYKIYSNYHRSNTLYTKLNQDYTRPKKSGPRWYDNIQVDVAALQKTIRTAEPGCILKMKKSAIL